MNTTYSHKTLPLQSNKRKSILILLATIGPSLTVMLADTDAGSIITAAQSGAKWGYKLLLLQVLLIPILYFVQELTTRIGITTGRGHGELIIEQIANALTPFLGSTAGRAIFAVGITGAALIAAIVVSLATSWAFGEVLKVPCSLNCTWKQAPAFYAFYSGGIIVSAILVLAGIPLISLTIAVEVMNSLLLPIVLGFLLALGWKVLPEKYKLHRWEKIVLSIIYLLVCSLGLFTVVQLF